MNRYPASLANHLSAYGRYGDDQLVHMNRQEVAALDGIAAAFGRELTRNPHTGMKEAFNLFDVLPIALNFIPGIGTAASIALSAASGAASSAIEGGDPLEGALMGGLTGAVGTSLGGGADAAKGVADVGKVTLPTAQAATEAGLQTVTTAVPEKALQEALSKPLIGAGGEIAGQAAAPGAFQDIFGAGTDAEISDALQSVWKKENLPYTIMGGTALSMLPGMFAGEEPGLPEYKDIPENFPVNPRMINPDYDPSLAGFGEQNAFSSGVDYLGRGFAEGGSVDKDDGFNPFNIQNMLGGVVPMIIDGFTDGNKYGSGILGMLFNKRKPWEYGQKEEGNMQMANAPSIPAPGSNQMMNSPGGFSQGGTVTGGDIFRGIASRMDNRGRGGKSGKQGQPQPMTPPAPRPRNIQMTNPASLYAGAAPQGAGPNLRIPLPGGQVPGYKGGGRVTTTVNQAPRPGMIWDPNAGTQRRGLGRVGSGGKSGMTGDWIDAPYAAPRQRNIQMTDPQSMIAGGTTAQAQPSMTPPLPDSGGGMEGSEPVGKGGFMPEPNPSSFEMATSPTGEAPMGGGMGQGYQGGGQGGGKRGLPGGVTPSRADPQGGGKVGRSGAVKPEEQPQVNPGLQTGIMSAMGPGGAPGQANPVEPTQPSGPVGMGVGFAMGGMVDRAMEMDDRTVVKEAMAAIMGQSPNPDAAIMMFVDRFGEEALQMLMQKAQGGQQGRYIEGPGDGLSDSIPAMVDGQQPSALSTGEFVVPADAVSHLGNGDNKTGAKELYGMIDRLRQARTGNPTPPPAIDQRSVMPA